ncbi:hypothetical protein [Rhodoluna sp.]|uniref:hypothetical protein n=1 Tax=Rhodoluna sp. TaxID=1969481 RepID=UPI0025F19EEF|nr:hypothetical protein [Rhodoluna sp.]
MAFILVLAPVPLGASAEESSQIANGDWSIEVAGGFAQVTWDVQRYDADVTVEDSDGLLGVGGSEGSLNLGFTGNSELEITLSMRAPLSKPEAAEIAIERGVDIKEVLSSVEYHEVSHLRISPDGGFGEVSADAATLPAYSILRYMTFIPEAYVAAPGPVCTGGDLTKTYRFAGDDRSFGPGNTSFRTKFDVKIDWLNQGAVTKTVSVGETIRQVRFSDGSWSSGVKRTALDSTMRLNLDGVQRSDFVSFNIEQDVTNPFCSVLTNGIYFNYDVTVSRSGAYSFKGSAIKVPNHEVYIKDQDNPSWSIIARRSYPTFDCLNQLLFTANSCMYTNSISGVR